MIKRNRHNLESETDQLDITRVMAAKLKREVIGKQVRDTILIMAAPVPFNF